MATFLLVLPIVSAVLVALFYKAFTMVFTSISIVLVSMIRFDRICDVFL